MLYGCDKLKTVYLNSLNNLSGTNMSAVFYAAAKLEYLDIRSLSFNGITSYSSFLPGNINLNATIVVADDTAKTWVRARLTDAGVAQSNVTIKTVAEL